MTKYTLQEWHAEGKRRFGDDYKNWRFVCPACGRINVGYEFNEAGAEPNDMYATCIGRHNGKGEKPLKGNETPNGCDWAAFGLLKTLGKGNIVISDDGNETEVFAFEETEVVGNA